MAKRVKKKAGELCRACGAATCSDGFTVCAPCYGKRIDDVRSRNAWLITGVAPAKKVAPHEETLNGKPTKAFTPIGE